MCKNLFKNSHPFGKISENPRGGIFLTHKVVWVIWAVLRQVVLALTLWRPLLPYGYAYKSILCQTVICNFWHPGTLTLSRERQSARMSNITNDDLIQSDTGCFIAAPIWKQWTSRGTFDEMMGANSVCARKVIGEITRSQSTSSHFVYVLCRLCYNSDTK